MKKLKFLILPVTVLALAACNRLEENPGPGPGSDPALPAGANAETPGSILEAFPGQKGEIKEGTFLGGKIQYERIGEYNVFDQDILLPDEQLAADASSPNGRTNAAGITGYRASGLRFGRRWPGGIIYYTIDPAFINPAVVTAAIEKFNQQTNVRFVPRTSESNYVYISNGIGNSSYLGMDGGKQDLSLLIGSTTVGVALHELGHAVGLAHEHNRADRDTYLNVNLSNVDQSNHYAFNIYDDYPGVDYGAFDFSSIMLYDSFGFAKDANIPVLTKKDGSVFISSDSSPNANLSAGDVALINVMYPAWTPMPEKAIDIGVGANGTICAVRQGEQVFRWNGARWVDLKWSGRRIDVDGAGRPWIVNSANRIYRFNGRAWKRVRGAAKDISIGANGSVYVVGTDNSVYRWAGTGWVSVGGEASRITVDVAGNAFIVNLAGQVSFYNLANGTWNPVRAPNGRAKDIGAGPSGVYVTNTSGEIMKYGNDKWFLMNGGGGGIEIDGGVSGASVIDGGNIYTF